MKPTIPELLNFACETFPNDGYLFEKTDAGWQGTTYQQTRERARAVAASLLSQDLFGNIAIISEGRPQWVISELGILLAGGTTVPLSMKLLAEEIPFRINHSDSKAIVISRNVSEKVMSVYSQYEKNPKIILLDSDHELAEELAKKHGLEVGKDLLLYQQLIDQGNEALKIQEVQSQLAEIEKEIGPEDTATICYTSGTTGNPKGAMLTHENFHENVRQSTDLFFIPFGLKTLVILPIDHSFAHTIALYAALLRKLALYFVDARGGSMSILRNIPGNLKEVQPDFLLTVPSLTQNFMNRMITAIRKKDGIIEILFRRGLSSRIIMNGDGYKTRPNFLVRFLHFWPYSIANLLIFPRLRDVFGGKLQFCVSGGAYLDITQQQFFKAIGVPVYQGYGLTEASPVISTNREGLHKIGSTGTTVPRMEVKIIDDGGNEVPPGQKGQILVKGRNVMKGYYKNPQATEEVIKRGWLYTGDLGLLDPHGFLYVMGREKALLISADGEKYSPEEIEEAIVNTSPMIAQCMLYCDHKKYVSALITLDPEGVEFVQKKKGLGNETQLLDELVSEFHSYLSQSAYTDRFPKVWTPKTFLVLDQPFSEDNKMINSTMKLIRHKVLEAYGEKVEYMYSDPGEKPQNSLNLEALKKMFFS
ncbi:MAG: AMP-binding protein [Spirochaetales bacterium]|nr:AMP-binding protein [Spirochaetales bacterium]